MDLFRPKPAKPLSPARRRRCIERVRQTLGVPVFLHVWAPRLARTLGQHRSTQRRAPRGRRDEALLTEDIIALARDYGRHGYRMVTGLLNNAGWHGNHKRVERIWRREGERGHPPPVRGWPRTLQAVQEGPALAQ